MRVLLLAKIIPSVLPASGLSVRVAPLHAGGEIEDGKQLGAGEVGDGEKVTGWSWRGLL